jgi:hypothetical protein
MRAWRYVRIGLRLAMAGAILYLGWTFLSRKLTDRRFAQRIEQRKQPAPPNPAFEKVYGGSDLRILQFYAREANLVEGAKTVICYGVMNARAVRIDPPVSGVSPALNRCVEVAPEQDTRYTLTAEGADGRTVSEAFTIGVKADPGTLPQITSFGITGRKMEREGELISLSFGTRNAILVSIDPEEFPPLHGAPYGHFYVAPKKTTTYTLTVTGKKGRKVQKSVTVEPRSPP